MNTTYWTNYPLPKLLRLMGEPSCIKDPAHLFTPYKLPVDFCVGFFVSPALKNYTKFKTEFLKHLNLKVD